MSGAGYDVAGDSCSWNIDTSRVAFHGDGARRVVLTDQGDTAILHGHCLSLTVIPYGFTQ